MEPDTSVMTIEDSSALTRPRLHSPWKRLACDRCRTMKLRCPRADGDLAGPCNRCIRCRAPCFTSSPKPPGRPSLKRSASIQGPIETTTDSGPFGSRQRTTGDLHGFHNDNEVNKPNNDSLGFLNQSSVDTPIGNPDFSSSHHVGIPDDRIRGDEQQTLSSDFLSELVTTWPTMPGHDPIFNDQEMDTTGDAPTTGSLISEDTLVSTSARDSDPGILLSNLQADLSGQLFRVKSVHWDMSILSNTCLPIITSDKPEEDSDSASHSNPFTAVLNSTVSFIDVIRVLGSSVILEEHSNSPEFRDQASAFNSNNNTLSTAHQLTIFSCYLQLLSIYHEILCRLLDSLLEKPNQTGYERRLIPELCFAGHLVRGELLCRLVSQVVEYQLELVEKSLGLPRQYCVSSNRQNATYHVNAGLLRGMEGSALLGAVMAASPDGGEGSGSRVVTLVRDKLQMLHRIL